jgi:acyl transferase domain-containing protein
VGGVIKMVMAMRHWVHPQTRHVDQPTPQVDWSAGAVRLLTEATPWDRHGEPRRAGVSSFGISGTNAHVVLEEAPAEPVAAGGTADTSHLSVVPCPVSGKSAAAVRAQAERLRIQLAGEPTLGLLDVGYSLATTRPAFAHRAVVLAADRDELVGGLDALAAGASGGSGPAVLQGVAGGKVGYLFTGQGSQRPGMGRELYERFPVFARALDAICEQFDPLLDWPLRHVLFAAEGSADAALLDQTEFTQPGLFAVEIALFRLFEHWGLTPDVLLGHSIGEVAAAHAAGVLTLPDACRLVAARGRLMQALPAGGAMVALQATEDEVLPLLRGQEAQLGIAAINGPQSLVISGDDAAVTAVAARWAAQGRWAKRLRVSHAFHSPHMDRMLAEFSQAVEGLTVRSPEIPIVSNVTGELLTAEQASSVEYWVRHVREPVRFLDGMRRLAADGVRTLVELGPGGALCAMGQDCLSGDDDPAVLVPAPAGGPPRGAGGADGPGGVARQRRGRGLGGGLRRSRCPARRPADVRVPEAAVLAGGSPLACQRRGRGGAGHGRPPAAGCGRRAAGDRRHAVHQPAVRRHPPLAGRPPRVRHGPGPGYGVGGAGVARSRAGGLCRGR